MVLSWEDQEAESLGGRTLTSNTHSGLAPQEQDQSPRSPPLTSYAHSDVRGSTEITSAFEKQHAPASTHPQSSLPHAHARGSVQSRATNLPMRKEQPYTYAGHNQVHSQPVYNTASNWSFAQADLQPLTPVTNSPPQGLNSSPSVNGVHTPSTSSEASRAQGLSTTMESLGKRRRELASESADDYRSKRPTPEPLMPLKAPEMSRESSDDFPESLRELLGSDPKEDLRSIRQAQIEQEDMIRHEKERKAAQEAADAEMARRLEEQWNAEQLNESLLADFSRPKPQKRPSLQSVFTTKGTIRRPSPPPAPAASVRTDFISHDEAGPSNPLHSQVSLARPLATSDPEFFRVDSDDDDVQFLASQPVHHATRTLPWPATNTNHSTSSASHAIDLTTLPSNGVLDNFGANPTTRNKSIFNPYMNFPNQMLPGFPSVGSYHGSAGQSVYNSTMNNLGASGSGSGRVPGAFHNNAAYRILDDDIASYGLAPHGFGAVSGYAAAPSTFFNGLAGPSQTPRMPWGLDDDLSDDDMGGFHSRSGMYHDQDNSEALRDLLNNIRPDEEENLGSDERGDGTPEGMADTANLYKYQAKGLAWLVKMEEGSNKGSILADDMGLGKTIQAIALMVSRPSTDSRCKTNLIVAPVALIRQWESEIATKIRPSHKLRTYIYHGTSAEKKKATFEYLSGFDVVITTYGALQTDSKKMAKLSKLSKENPDYRPKPADKPVLIGTGCKWYRCILDEAQNIKNKAAKTSLAAYELQSVYRLIMTGTPMMNNVVELYSLIHFLRIQPYCQWEKFNVDFARPLKNHHGKERAMKKVQALLKAIMIRRTKKSQMDGKPLIVLPERQMNIAGATFEDDEKNFYQALEGKIQLQFNKFVKAGTVGKHYSNVLTLLLRLRQAACHPHLIKDFAVAVDATPEDLLEAARGLPEETVQRLIGGGITECPVCMDAAENYTIFHPCGHNTCPECFCRLSDSAQNQAAANDGSGRAPFNCHSCRATIDPKKTTDYIHFKMVHMPKLAAEEGLKDIDGPSSDIDSDGSDEDSETDDEDESDDGSDLDDFIVPDDAPIAKVDLDDESGDDLDEIKPARPQKKEQKLKDDKHKMNMKQEVADDEGDRDFVPYEPGYQNGANPFEKANGKRLKKHKSKDKKGKGKEKKKSNSRKTLAVLKKEAMRSKKSRVAYMKRLAKDFVPSAKTSRTMEILQNIQDAPEGEKTIVFSQFTSLLDLMEIPINAKGWKYTRFDGSMNATDRNTAVQLFTKEPRYKIMLVSLKAGNAGLNLTAASQVVILDPFWNPYIEEQAIDRAHRIGQRRTVQVHRVLVEETVEDRILKLQEQKRALIESALDEGAAQSIGRLDVRQLAYLFGVGS